MTSTPPEPDAADPAEAAGATETAATAETAAVNQTAGATETAGATQTAGATETAGATQIPDPVGGAAAAADSAAGEGVTSSPAGEPGRPEPVEASADPVRLLVHAVGQLPPDQRDLVLTWLLRQRPGLSRQWTIGSRASEHAAELHALQLAAASQHGRGMQPTAQQVVPVRFPTQQHAQLREWCAEHGFSMATVIRGLVSRFLESQLPERN